jgi:hypothetical protein
MMDRVLLKGGQRDVSTTTAQSDARYEIPQLGDWHKVAPRWHQFKLHALTSLDPKARDIPHCPVHMLVALSVT